MTMVFGFFQLPLAPENLFALLIDLALKGLVILLVAAALTRALRKSVASARHLIWSLAVTGLLFVPVLELVMPAARRRCRVCQTRAPWAEIGAPCRSCHGVLELLDRKSTRLNSSHRSLSRMPSSA